MGFGVPGFGFRVSALDFLGVCGSSVWIQFGRLSPGKKLLFAGPRGRHI